MRLRSEIKHCNIVKQYIENHRGNRNEKIKQLIELYEYLSIHINWVKRHPDLFKRCQEKIIEFYFDDPQFYCFFKVFEINMNLLFQYMESENNKREGEDYLSDSDDDDDYFS